MKALLLLGAALALCCSSGDDAEPPSVCASGKSEACACASGETGAQICKGDGTGWGQCVCADATPGGAGESGAPSSGAGGTTSAGATGQGGASGTDASGADAGAGAGGEATIPGCAPLSCFSRDKTLMCGVLEDACGNKLDCGVKCGGLGTCGTDDEPHECSCGTRCGLCPDGDVLVELTCCTPKTECDEGGALSCGEVDDNCGGTLQCPETCDAGTCGGEAPENYCSCWLADDEAAYPCDDGLHNYDCWGGKGLEDLKPTVAGCQRNPTDETKTRWCCP